ncbi:MAG: leucine--tRNA ligase, partial [Alcaligenes aquatilis]
DVPVWVGNYVLMSYGDGAVMGVPAHDERDFAFALKYQLPIQQVIGVEGKEYDATQWQDWYGDKQQGQTINSGKYDGLAHVDAVDAIAADLNAKELGEKQTTYRLRDWGISRQRYWGTPIPIIHCDDCGPVPVPEKDLPVVLPEELIPDGSGNPLNKHEAFLKCACPSCGKPARRETDTMDTFVDSSWYFLRYTTPNLHDSMTDPRSDYWMPMDQYIGGIEHAVLHLLYARFWTKVMRDMGLVKIDEPFTRLLCQGMVLNHSYTRRTPQGGIEYFWPETVENIYDEKGAIIGARLKSDGQPVQYNGIGTMSKSKNNGVDPQSLIDTMGADTARLFIMFASPPEQTLEWSDSGVDGANRFLRRLWAFCYNRADALRAGNAQTTDWSDLDAAAKRARLEIHSLLKQANYDYERIQYNTVVSACMKMLNTLEQTQWEDTPAAQRALAETTSILLRVLYPVVPHITWQLWRELGWADGQGDMLDAQWPVVDEQALIADEVELMLQVNGKLRGSLVVPQGAEKAAIEQAAAEHAAVLKYLEGRPAKRIIVVPGKLVNVVG